MLPGVSGMGVHSHPSSHQDPVPTIPTPLDDCFPSDGEAGPRLAVRPVSVSLECICCVACGPWNGNSEWTPCVYLGRAGSSPLGQDPVRWLLGRVLPLRGPITAPSAAFSLLGHCRGSWWKHCLSVSGAVSFMVLGSWESISRVPPGTHLLLAVWTQQVEGAG